MLKRAVLWRFITYNASDAVSAPKPARREIPVLTTEEIQRLLAAADKTDYGDFIFLAMLTGLRRGEIMGLKWGDVPKDGDTLAVRRTCQ